MAPDTSRRETPFSAESSTILRIRMPRAAAPSLRHSSASWRDLRSTSAASAGSVLLLARYLPMVRGWIFQRRATASVPSSRASARMRLIRSIEQTVTCGRLRFGLAFGFGGGALSGSVMVASGRASAVGPGNDRGCGLVRPMLDGHRLGDARAPRGSPSGSGAHQRQDRAACALRGPLALPLVRVCSVRRARAVLGSRLGLLRILVELPEVDLHDPSAAVVRHGRHHEGHVVAGEEALRTFVGHWAKPTAAAADACGHGVGSQRGI